MNISETFNTAIESLLSDIKSDYLAWGNKVGEDVSEIRKTMNKEFCDSLRVEKGRKYIKIITGGSVWGFVMIDDDKKFSCGDILKAASWSTPARNFARGNIFNESNPSVRWTGPL